MDTNVAFQCRELLFDNFAFNDVEINLQLNKGDLNIDPLKFSIGGGTTEGIFTLYSSKTPLFMATSLAIDHFAIGAMLKQLGQESSLKGTWNTSTNLYGRGDSIAALMAGLNGKFILTSMTVKSKANTWPFWKDTWATTFWSCSTHSSKTPHTPPSTVS